MEDGHLRIRSVLRIGNIKSSVNDWDPATSTGVKLVEELFTFFIRKAMLVIVKIAISMHVIDIGPAYRR